MTPRLLETRVKSYNQIRRHVTNFGGAKELEMMFVQCHTYSLVILSDVSTQICLKHILQLVRWPW